MTEKVLQVAGGRAKWCSDFRKVWQFLVKLNILLPNGPAVSQLKELKTCAHQELCESVSSSFFFFFSFFLVLEHVGSYFLSPGMEAVSPAVEAES